MALVPAVSIYNTTQNGARCNVITWGVPTAENTPSYPLAGDQITRVPPAPTYYFISQGDTCAPLLLPAGVDKSVQFMGSNGVGGSNSWNGATLAIQGSNDGTNFCTLNDTFGVALTGIGSDQIRQINEETKWIKWVLTGGGGQTAINVIIQSKANF